MVNTKDQSFIFSSDLVEELSTGIKKLEADFEELKELTQLKVEWNNLHCITKQQLSRLLSCKVAKIDRLIKAGLLTPIDLPGHTLFNVMQLAIDLNIPYVELKRKIVKILGKGHYFDQFQN